MYTLHLILYSVLADKYYVGHTDDYENRLKDHNTQNHFDTFTSKHRPWNLSAIFACGKSRTEAMKLEKFIKRQKSRSFIEKLIDPNFIPTGVLAQLVRVPHLRD